MIDDIKVKSFYDDGFIVWDFLSIKTIKIRFPKLLKGEKPDAVGLIINGELSDYLLDDKAISFLKQYRAHLEARDKGEVVGSEEIDEIKGLLVDLLELSS